MEAILSFISNHPGLTVFLVIMVTIIILAVLGAIVFLLFKGKFKAKILGNEISTGNGTDNPKNSSNDINSTNTVSIINNKSTDSVSANRESFLKCMSNIISDSVQEGYDRSEKRQELFDSQLKETRECFDMVITRILSDYGNKDDFFNIQTIEILVRYIFENLAIKKLKKIYQADRLAEKTKDLIIDQNRPFIDALSTNISIEASKLIEKSSNEGFILVDDNLIKIINNHATEIKNAAVSSLEKAYSEAVEYLDEVNRLKDKFSKHITNTIIALNSDLSNHIGSKTWDESMPPNSITGA